MFKLLTLKPGVDDELQSIQDKWEILGVENLGADSVFNHYLLVQYDTKPSPSLTAKAAPAKEEAQPQETAKKPGPKAAK